MFTFLQNDCSRSPRIGVHVAPEYAVDDGAGGIVDQVFLQLLGEGGFRVDVLDTRCGVEPLQHARGHHRGDQRFDVLALPQVVERLADVAFVVEALRMRQPF